MLYFPKTDHHDKASFKAKEFEKSHGVKPRVVQSVYLRPLLIEIKKMQVSVQSTISEDISIIKCTSAVFNDNFRKPVDFCISL